MRDKLPQVAIFYTILVILMLIAVFVHSQLHAEELCAKTIPEQQQFNLENLGQVPLQESEQNLIVIEQEGRSQAVIVINGNEYRLGQLIELGK